MYENSTYTNFFRVVIATEIKPCENFITEIFLRRKFLYLWYSGIMIINQNEIVGWFVVL